MDLGKERLSQLAADLEKWCQDRMAAIASSQAVVGISGGKDSSVVAALAVRVCGKDQVTGVLMPYGDQADIDVARDLCQHLGIRSHEINIAPAGQALTEAVEQAVGPMSRQGSLNLPPRVRMAVLYAVAQTLGGVVWNTSNLSEDWVGYATIYGDTAGAFSPLATLTTDEVIQLGRFLGLPDRFVEKPPADGLTGKTDEDVLGFSYADLNRYIRTGVCEDPAVKAQIDRLHRTSRFKFKPIEMFHSGLPIGADDIAGIYKND
ncbi:NAD(+) synthase [Peptococcus simiae]|uniref:NAD(+) synthase n=1 Tax=Peptococcus simiae TaxID=1643805 RepID=UPI00397E9DE4